jgi:hypothetical protein
MMLLGKKVMLLTMENTERQAFYRSQTQWIVSEKHLGDPEFAQIDISYEWCSFSSIHLKTVVLQKLIVLHNEKHWKLGCTPVKK